MREAREAKGLSLAEAAELLKMRKVLVEALEGCRFELLPEQPLARGYIRRYAKLLGLEAEALLALYPGSATEIRTRTLLPPRNPTLTGGSAQPGSTPKITPAPRPNPTLTPAPSARPAYSATASPPQRGGMGWLWAVPLGLLLGAGGWWYLSRTPAPAAPVVVQQPAVVTPPPAPRQVTLRVSTQPAGARVFLDGFLLGQAPLEARIEEGERTLRIEAQGFQSYERVLALSADRNLNVALSRVPSTPATPGSAANPASPAQTGQPPAQAGAITIRMDGRSWIRVVNPVTGQELYEGIPAQGAQLNYPGPVLVRAGNAGAVRVIVGGQDRGLMGREGQVLSQRYGQ